MQISNTPGLRVAVYARVSTEEQRQGQAIDSQIAELMKFAEQSSWTITSVYKDEGWSGGMLARPELDRLRDDARSNNFEAVLVNDVDRLARDVTHLGIIKRDLERSNVRLIFRKLPGENSPTHDLMINILGSFAQFERELIADRTRRGMRHKAEVRQQYVGCTAPYGYRYRGKHTDAPHAGILQIEPHEAEVVRKVFHWVADESMSLNQVARRLQQERILTRTGKSHWQVGMVWRVVRNRTYIGQWSYAKKESVAPRRARTRSYLRRAKTSRRTKPESDWISVALPVDLQILDKSLWERAQRQIDANPRWCPRNAKHKYLLQGLARCGFCKCVAFGSYMNSNKLYFYYRCSKACEESRWLRRDDVEEVAWAAVKGALQSPNMIENLIVKARQKMVSDRNCAVVQQEATAQIDAKQREDRLIAEYRAGRLSASDLGQRLKQLEWQSKVIKPDSEHLSPPQNISNRSLTDYLAQFAERLENASFETRQLVLRQIVTAVLLTPDKIVIRAALPDVTSGDVAQAPTNYAIDSMPSSGHIGNCRMVEFEMEAGLPHR